MADRDDDSVAMGSTGYLLALAKLVELLLVEVTDINNALGRDPVDRLLALRAKATAGIRQTGFGALPNDEVAKIHHDAEQTLKAMFAGIRFVARE